MIRRLFTFLALTVFSCQAASNVNANHYDTSGDVQKSVVYGADERRDVYAHSDAVLQERARQSTVALMFAESFDATDPSNVRFGGRLQDAENLCDSERFLDDPVSAYCSGTLIDHDLILTAGHCISRAQDCENVRFVFNYYRPAEGALPRVSTDDIFRCKAIVATEQSNRLGMSIDYSVVQLDRMATPRFTPAPVRQESAPLLQNDRLAVIGSGSGIPFKIDSGGAVRDVRNTTRDYFVATTDTFIRSSGSGVYERSQNRVAGILVRGEGDYVNQGTCNVANVCAPDDCGGEAVTYVSHALRGLCGAEINRPHLCQLPDGGSLGPSDAGIATERFDFEAAQTSYAKRNTVDRSIALRAGQRLSFGTCGLDGASGVGDSYLRLMNAEGVELTSGDDECGKLSFGRYLAAANEVVTLRAGCYGETSCRGAIVLQIEDLD